MQSHMLYLLCTLHRIYQSKDAHWFYNPQTDRVISTRSFNMVAGIPKDWLIGHKMTGPVKDEEWDFVQGPRQYDVWQRGATAVAVAMDPQGVSYEFPINNIPTDIVLLNSPTLSNTKLVIQSQEVTLDNNPPEVASNSTAPPTVTVDITTDTPISNRTRSTGKSEGLSIKKVISYR